jgi:hypothetical protein
MGDRRRAKDCFRRALRVRPQLARTTMEVIASTAEIVGVDGDPVRAAELLAFVAAHPYTPHRVRQSAAKLLAELQAELPSDVYVATTARGRARELTDVVAEIVSEGEKPQPSNP